MRLILVIHKARIIQHFLSSIYAVKVTSLSLEFMRGSNKRVDPSYGLDNDPYDESETVE